MASMKKAAKQIAAVVGAAAAVGGAVAAVQKVRKPRGRYR
jgi:hypothetical protein